MGCRGPTLSCAAASLQRDATWRQPDATWLQHGCNPMQHGGNTAATRCNMVATWLQHRCNLAATRCNIAATSLQPDSTWLQPGCTIQHGCPTPRHDAAGPKILHSVPRGVACVPQRDGIPLQVLAGTVSVEAAGGAPMPFCGGRTDASDGLGSQVLYGCVRACVRVRACVHRACVISYLIPSCATACPTLALLFRRRSLALRQESGADQGACL